MPTPRPIQWNDWARPSYAGRPLYTSVDNVNMKGFDLGLPDIVPPELRRLGFEPIEKDPSTWGKFDQLGMVGKSLGFAGNLFDELYRGQVKDDPRWSIAGMPDMPGIGGLKKTKSAIEAAKKLAKKEAQANTVAEVVKASRFPHGLPGVEGKYPVPDIPGAAKPLPEVAGTIPKSAQLRQQQSNPLFATVPNRLLVTEGPVKTGLQDAANMVKPRPTLSYIRQELRNAGYAPDPFAPKLLPETGVGRKPDFLPEFGGAIRPPTDLPPIDLGSLYKPPPKLPDIGLPSLGKTPVLPGGPSQNAWRSIENQLRADSPAGRQIADRYTAYQIDKGNIAGRWEAKFNKIIQGIDPKSDDWRRIQESLESRVPLEDARLEKVRKRLATLDKEMVGAAQKSELKLRNPEGDLIPFVPHEGYWPHIYPPEFWKDADNVARAIVAKYEGKITLDQAKQIVTRAKDRGGRLIVEPERLGKEFAARYGTQLKSFQLPRLSEQLGYRTDPGAYKIHIRDMADRLASKKYFGDRDIAGIPQSQGGTDEFATLMDNLSPDRKNELKRQLVQLFNRESVVPDEGLNKLARGAMTISTAKNLPMFALTNLAQNMATAAKSTPRGLFEAAKTAIPGTKAAKRRLDIGLKSGATTLVHSPEMQGAYGMGNTAGDALSNMYGISAGERYNRSIAAVAGRTTAEDLFARLKKNPASDRLRNRLEELTMTPANELLAQDRLTRTQLDRAGGMMSIRTQGHAGKFELPPFWTGGRYEDVKNLALQFKKYPYVQANLFMNSLARNPAQTLGAGTLAYLLAGEGIGAVKDAKRALVDKIVTGQDLSSAWDEQRKKRGEGLGRIGKGLMESWQYGLPADIASEAAYSSPLAAFTPVTAEMFNEAWTAADPFGKKKNKKKRDEARLNYLRQWISPLGLGRDINAVLKKPTHSGSLPPIPQTRLPEGW